MMEAHLVLAALVLVLADGVTVSNLNSGLVSPMEMSPFSEQLPQGLGSGGLRQTTGKDSVSLTGSFQGVKRSDVSAAIRSPNVLEVKITSHSRGARTTEDETITAPRNILGKPVVSVVGDHVTVTAKMAKGPSTETGSKQSSQLTSSSSYSSTSSSTSGGGSGPSKVLAEAETGILKDLKQAENVMSTGFGNVFGRFFGPNHKQEEEKKPPETSHKNEEAAKKMARMKEQLRQQAAKIKQLQLNQAKAEKAYHDMAYREGKMEEKVNDAQAAEHANPDPEGRVQVFKAAGKKVSAFGNPWSL